VIGLQQIKQQGFTLIEILLVIVIMMVVVAMVAPSFFQATGASVDGEARYMQKLLRLATEEAQLSGRAIRCAIYEDHIIFAASNSEGKWLALHDQLFAQADAPKAPVVIADVQPDGGVSLQQFQSRQKEEQPAMAYVMFFPDGRVTAAHIVLAIADTENTRTIALRSGPGGIHVVKKAAL